MKLPLHIGIDDTDSVWGGCTTYIAALLVEKLNAETFLDHPGLIRLNPNVPWKTRGNAALSLRISIDEELIDATIEMVISTVEEMSQLDYPGTDPGIVFLVGDVPLAFTSFARRTIQDLVSKKEAMDLIKRYGAEAVGFKGGRGIIGALAAVGETLLGDYTFELIAYRTVQNRGKPRMVNSASVFKMDREMSGLTFNNVDYEKMRVLLTPGGPDPVLLGVRGESSKAVMEAYQLIDVCEDVERWVIFRTNQGTDAHLLRVETILNVHPYRPVAVVGFVDVEPHYISGGHLIFTIEDGSGRIDCAAYEPTGRFRRSVEKLIKGDEIEVFGGIRPSSMRNPKTLNIEKLRVITLAPKIVTENPLCNFCGKRMESMGRGKGFRCKNCDFRMRDGEKVCTEIGRELEERLYIPPARANRHLTKPQSRYGLEKTDASPFSSPLPLWGYGLNRPR